MMQRTLLQRIQPYHIGKTFIRVFAVTIVGWGIPCAAQGTVQGADQDVLDWPSPNPDVTAYATVFECLFAAEREGLRAPERLVVRDTMPLEAEDVVGPLPILTKTTAQRCSAKFHPDSVPLSEYAWWISLYLQADRDADANTVARRRLDAVGTGRVKRTTPFPDDPETRNVSVNVRERAEVLRTVAGRYLSASPARLAAAVPYVREIEELGSASPWSERAQVAWSLFSVARLAEDTALTQQGAQWLIEIPKHVPEPQRQTPQYQSVTGAFMAAHRYVTRDVAFDSLKMSTTGYMALQRSLRREISRADDWIGTTAKPITGDFWFPSKAAMVPAPGHVTVILAEQGIREWASRDLGAMFRRWKSRFPSLDIVYVTHTRGYFSSVEPPSPEQEAQYRRRQVQDFYNYPASVVVTNTQFWRLPNPDRRRVNIPTINETNYGNRLWLVDQTGTIIYYSSPGKGAEKDFTELIAALMSRP